jgi:hypothetical protein
LEKRLKENKSKGAMQHSILSTVSILAISQETCDMHGYKYEKCADKRASHPARHG